MTRPKPSYSTTNMQTPICTKLIACDGMNLVGEAARTRGYCAKCRDAMDKKAAGPKVTPPRGENSALAKTAGALPETWNHYNPMGDD